MSDTFITVMAIMVAAVVLFAIPIMATASQNDNITQSAVQTLVSNFVNTAAREGKITQSNYNDFIQELYATGNSYQVDLEVQTLADNPGKKGAAGESIQVCLLYTSDAADE